MTASSVPPESLIPHQGAAPGSTPARRRLPVFDGARGIAALALLITHVAFTASLLGSYTQPPSNRPGAFFIVGFQVTIGIFFTLSGLFLYRPFARAIIAGTPKPELGPYFLRRALRLLPPYYVMTAVALLFLNLSAIHSAWFVLRPIVLMQNYSPAFLVGMDITWTVPTEIQWYIALPVMAFLCQAWARRASDPAARARRLLLPTPLLFIGGLAWFAYVHRPSMGPYPPKFFWPFGMAGSIGIGMSLGVLSALTQVSPANTPKLFQLAARRQNLFWLVAVAGYILYCLKPFGGHRGYGDYDTEAGGILFYCVLVLFGLGIITPLIASSAPSRLIKAVVANRPIVFIGRISYGVYLWHFVVMNLYLRNGSVFGGDLLRLDQLRGRAGFWELESVVIAGTIAVAIASFYLIERPVMQWGERVIEARRAAKAPSRESVPGLTATPESTPA